MAKRDTTPVKVKLDTVRYYRLKNSDSEAIEVGPGEVEVPAWVAAKWDQTAQAAAAKNAADDDDEDEEEEASPPAPASEAKAPAVPKKN